MSKPIPLESLTPARDGQDRLERAHGPRIADEGVGTTGGTAGRAGSLVTPHKLAYPLPRSYRTGFTSVHRERIDHARTTYRATEEGEGRGRTRLLAESKTLDALRQAESRLMGKQGPLGGLLGQIGKLPAEVRGAAGKEINQAKARITELFAAAKTALEQAADKQASAEQTYDPTLPGPVVPRGSVHPVTAVQWEVEEILARIGFVVVGGPEMETDYYNFEALNIPAMHPARDMQDTFWLTNGWLLRTHTSPCQVRAMLRLGPPLSIIAPGRVLPLRDRGRLARQHLPSARRADDRPAHLDRQPDRGDEADPDRDLPPGHQGPAAAGVFPVRRAGLRAGHAVRHLRRQRLPDLQAQRLGRDPALRHGPPERAPQRRTSIRTSTPALRSAWA